jgi:uncharacterized protein
MIVLSHYQAREFLFKTGKFIVSLDLGMSRSEVEAKGDGFILPDGQKIGHDDIKTIIEKDNICFFLEDSAIYRVSLFSEDTNKFYKLVPTGLDTPPTLEISGIRMHVTKKFSPMEDTIKKVSFVLPCKGNVLDTCTGLGYTAIEASKHADMVHTFEKDENVITIQKHNPWSAKLFSSDKIKPHHGDISEEIAKLDPLSFDNVIHDPPRLSLASYLYSEPFYEQLFRVMKPGGKLYHYTGEPGSKNRGIDLQANVMRRLAKVGFRNPLRVFNGVTATR